MLDEVFWSKVPRELPPKVIRRLEDRNKLGTMRFVYKCANWRDPLTGLPESGVEVICSECERAAYYQKRKEVSHCVSYSKIGFFDPESGRDFFSVADGDEKVFTCPYCGKKGEVVHTGDIPLGGRRIGQAVIGRLAVAEGRLVVLSFLVEAFINKAASIRNMTRLWSAFAVDGGKLYKAVGHQSNFGRSQIWFTNWVPRKKCDLDYPSLDGWVDEPVDFSETECRNCHIDDYIKGCQPSELNPDIYLAVWLRHPNLECLVTSGAQNLINEIFMANTSNVGYYYNHHTVGTRKTPQINFKARKPHEMLGLTKEDFKICLIDNWDLEHLTIHRALVSAGQRATSEEIRWIREVLESDEVIDAVGRGCNVMHLVRYMIKQRKQNGAVTYKDLTDCWNMLENRIGRRLTTGERYPRNIATAHDNEVRRIKIAKKQAVDEAVRKRFRELSSLSWQDAETGLLIRPCTSVSDLVREGAELQHCVATYANKIADGITAIYMIRRLEDKGKPYFTLELDVKNLKVIQNRGFKNRDRTPDVVAFEEKWLNYYKSRRTRIHAG